MGYEKSCGAVIYRKNGSNIEFLAVKSNGFSGYWGFPKGHVEEGETEEETCLREVYEETGLKVSLDKKFRNVDGYLLGSGIKKEVVYFLGMAESNNVIVQEVEIADYRWGSFEEIYDLLTFRTARNILEKAEAYLRKGRKSF